MNQASLVPFGSNPAVVNGYMFTANDRLGNIDLVYENRGDNDAQILLQEAYAPSGFTPLDGWFTVAARGTVTKSYKLVNKVCAFFGTGNTVVNISAAIRNPADLRGAQFDISITGRKGWGFNPAFDSGSFLPNWGNFTDLL